MRHDWFNLPPGQVVQELKSDQTAGLSTQQAAEQLNSHGYNELQEKARESLFSKLIGQFKDFLVLILIVASLVSAFLGEIVDSVAILVIVILNAVLGIVQESKAEKALAALKQMSAPNSKVIRDGKTISIPARDLVPGDLVLVEAGDRIPADLRILETFSLKVEEASLTGESVPVEKSSLPLNGDVALADRTNMAFMSTLVTYGRAKGIVVATAMQTEIGKIANLLQTGEKEITPLQRKLGEFSKTLGVACLGVCTLVFFLGIYNAFKAAGSISGPDVQLMLMTAISLAVAAIPEGLPAVVTIVLALGMQRMARKNSIVRKLHAVETLGSITVICSDKTGTLTQNQMTVTKAYANGKVYDLSGEGYDPSGEIRLNSHQAELGREQDLALLLQGIALCNDAKLTRHSDTNAWGIIGDPTEGALLTAAAKAGITQEGITLQFPRVKELPFDSGRKMMTTIHSFGQDYLAFTKGAPDILISRCTKIMAENQIRPLDAEMISQLQQINHDLAGQALRVLAVACRQYAQLPVSTDSEQLENDLVLIGLVGMIDPPRSEAREAVKVCVNAGIRPIMITGDHQDTAQAIALDLGIITDKNQSMTGKQLDQLSKPELSEAVKHTSVFARVSPENKVAIVEALKANNQIVAMTGDGINDAPALKKADIGVAMGITGTDVTKETADMVVTDDNFATIVSAVEEGRTIFANIRKFIAFLLSCNLSEVLVIFIAMLLGWPIPLLPIQLLWVNLVTDAFPALALGMEKKESDIMKLPPRDPSEPIVNKPSLFMIGLQSLAITVVVLGAFAYGYFSHNDDISTARTFAFITLVNSQLLCAYAARSAHFSVFKAGLFSNKYMNMAVAFSFLLMLIAIGPLEAIFKTQPLSVQDWLIIAGLSPLPFLVAEIGKLIYFKQK
ncbi:cation-translocating P-type ATPase|uniref:P-type Ca(2+) transporter n=1 Tax=Dendrosporobacter quercicolus TaxID=146817 RepID=A0A1G9XTF3_9FIRM|nr:cation-translocating P-type ATPase [Dendrosporobacter quercicolus]NSL49104.1 cation-translocating P-type ATPase [Dendrosporobacter quercicolus DSM 1736]SDM99455.1 Ca2+-transporting ATPase [Dendrosporobacter quercicolus]